MSGGHLNYVGSLIRRDCETIAEDDDVKARFPQLAQLFFAVGQWAYDQEHAIDWDLSGDAPLRASDKTFERKAIVALLEVVMKAAPDDTFPRGKWATIQAIQARRGSAVSEYAKTFQMLTVPAQQSQTGFRLVCTVWRNRGRGEVMIGAPSMDELRERWEQITSSDFDASIVHEVYLTPVPKKAHPPEVTT